MDEEVCPSVEQLGMGKPDGEHPVRAEQAYVEVLNAVWQWIEGGSKGAASMPYVTRVLGYMSRRCGHLPKLHSKHGKSRAGAIRTRT